MQHRILTAAAALAVATVVLSGCAGSTTSSVAADCEPAHEFTTVEEGKLTVAITEAAPFSSYANQKASGIDADIIEAIAEAECLDVAYTPMSYASAVPAVQNGRADLAIGGFYRSQSRAEIVALSDPLYLDQMAVISEDGSATISDLEGQKVGTVDGYIWVSDFQTIYGSDLTLYPSITEMKADLEAGRIQAGVEGFAVSSLLMGGSDFDVEVLGADDRVGSTTSPAQAGFPIAQDATDLLAAVNADVAALREDGTLAEMLEANGIDPTAAETGDPRLL
ncbi:substrate-binding periplasmic protein [Microbacterium allomyrinae]|uniref:Amino acid ABC transporter substrate-binding protein n=1 Tax=Microbacterium allomyrinae TaxID=2830666 RepID=A0A9X1LVK1_9MICO|nr:ABC transporter substrate-binding protein [Microbacterium allomyrinae]MCC2032642.1 amino acid ABC transporter substrate-binding protein [Microbacterium allomyrinae]